MAQSSLYRSLVVSTKLLGKTYLNFKARPAGDYTKRQMSSAAAYTVFAHAEVESFLEDWAKLITSEAKKRWANKKPTRTVAFLCHFSQEGSDFTEIPKKDIWNDGVVRAFVKHERTVEANHGIKESNVCRLFAPLGIDLRIIDPVLVSDLTTFGALRGDAAHKSHRTQLANAFDPFSRQTKVLSLVTLLKDFDTQLLAHLRNL